MALTYLEQYVEGPLLGNDSDLNKFRNFAQRVEELTLTDDLRKRYYKVSPDIITRLAMIQGAKAPGLLPSLKHLRLIDVDSNLAYLWFCIMPSIQTLEVSGIPQKRQITVSTFLKELVLKAPQLSKITLGPGHLAVNVLKGALQFCHLRQLEICNLATSLDFTYLQAVSALPYLEIFSINASTAEYTPYIPSEAGRQSISSIKAPEGTKDKSDPLSSASRERHILAFPRLAYLTVISNALLVCDLILHLFPKGIEKVSLTLVCDRLAPIPYPWLSANAPYWSAAVKAALRAHPPPATALEAVEVPYHTFKTEKGFKRICHGDREEDNHYICADCITLKYERVAKEERRWCHKFIPAVLCFSSAVDKICEISNAISIHIDCQEIALSTHAVPLALSSCALLSLLTCKGLVRLEIAGWSVPSIGMTFIGIPSTFTKRMSMSTLLLPLDASLNPGITLSTLRTISWLYPQLHHLNCRFSVIADDVRNSGMEDNYIFHSNLKELGVSGGLPMGMDDGIEIASHIYSLFPCLENITVLDKRDVDVWTSVHKLVKLCQKVREGGKSRARELSETCVR